jgi:hypothetical protein
LALSYLWKQAHWPKRWRVSAIAQFVLLLIAVQWRWERWTGRSPWQFESDLVILLAVGFLIFVFAIFSLFIKKKSIGSR